jgi:hypothetical protein
MVGEVARELRDVGVRPHDDLLVQVLVRHQRHRICRDDDAVEQAAAGDARQRLITSTTSLRALLRLLV